MIRHGICLTRVDKRRRKQYRLVRNATFRGNGSHSIMLDAYPLPKP